MLQQGLRSSHRFDDVPRRLRTSILFSAMPKTAKPISCHHVFSGFQKDRSCCSNSWGRNGGSLDRLPLSCPSLQCTPQANTCGNISGSAVRYLRDAAEAPTAPIAELQSSGLWGRCFSEHVLLESSDFTPQCFPSAIKSPNSIHRCFSGATGPCAIGCNSRACCRNGSGPASSSRRCSCQCRKHAGAPLVQPGHEAALLVLMVLLVVLEHIAREVSIYVRCCSNNLCIWKSCLCFGSFQCVKEWVRGVARADLPARGLEVVARGEAALPELRLGEHRGHRGLVQLPQGRKFIEDRLRILVTNHHLHIGKLPSSHLLGWYANGKSCQVNNWCRGQRCAGGNFLRVSPQELAVRHDLCLLDKVGVLLVQIRIAQHHAHLLA
mmetsp:Transcript_89861/g.262648  ORF Transcript_89861/g.262648 Transcript_89861/m.262648 type:complete len:379 (-) Transcript_89861:496-1632(-)